MLDLPQAAPVGIHDLHWGSCCGRLHGPRATAVLNNVATMMAILLDEQFVEDSEGFPPNVQMVVGS